MPYYGACGRRQSWVAFAHNAAALYTRPSAAAAASALGTRLSRLLQWRGKRAVLWLRALPVEGRVGRRLMTGVRDVIYAISLNALEGSGGAADCTWLPWRTACQGRGSVSWCTLPIAERRLPSAARRWDHRSPGGGALADPTAMRTIAAARMGMIGQEERLAVSNERMPPCRACCRCSPCSIP